MYIYIYIYIYIYLMHYMRVFNLFIAYLFINSFIRGHVITK